jgi:hypothetical protein
MRALLAVATGIIGLAAPPADACKCAGTSIEEAARRFDVVAWVTVGAARAEPDGTLSSPVTFDDVLRGPVNGSTQRVSWQKPDGKSCFLTDLRPGRWLVFLSWQPDGRLLAGRCDQHSAPVKTENQWRGKRAVLIQALAPVKSEAAAVEAAALAVRRMLVASMAGKPGTDLANVAPDGASLAMTDRALVAKQPGGIFLVRWSQNPPAGTAIDAEVRVGADGVAQVVRASASFSPD